MNWLTGAAQGQIGNACARAVGAIETQIYRAVERGFEIYPSSPEIWVGLRVYCTAIHGDRDLKVDVVGPHASLESLAAKTRRLRGFVHPLGPFRSTELPVVMS